MKGVQHLTIREVTLTRSAFWTVHMVGCQDVLIDGIRILNNLKMVNCDGIDPDHAAMCASTIAILNPPMTASCSRPLRKMQILARVRTLWFPTVR